MSENYWQIVCVCAPVKVARLSEKFRKSPSFRKIGVDHKFPGRTGTIGLMAGFQRVTSTSE